MSDSSQMRRLTAKWQMGTSWPKRLDWIEIQNLRGWDGQRFELRYPIMAVIGENGAGKSTVLQCAASVYASDSPSKKGRYASDFFPDTLWDQIRGAEIRYALREGSQPVTNSIRRLTTRWRGNADRRKRHVEYIDLSRIQPVPARVGYARLANTKMNEVSAEAFDTERLKRYSAIMGRDYDMAKMALTDLDANRVVPVVGQFGSNYSGFHQGAGETTILELLVADIPKYSLVLIDEVESSLHARVQRRFIRDLAERCRELELQVVLTTHSPYVLEELPLDARAYILQTRDQGRQIVYGVSPQFAMSKMDDEPYYECDLYVEDERAGRMLIEILAKHATDLVLRCQTIPYGSSSVGQALGQMVAGRRFPRPSCVFLDGDKSDALGCLLLPGNDAPERVVFGALRSIGWNGLPERVGRGYSDVADACASAMNFVDHHDWIRTAADKLVLSGETLWQAMCAEWAKACLSEIDAKTLVTAIQDKLQGIPQPVRVPVNPTPLPVQEPREEAADIPGPSQGVSSSNVQRPLF
jgi:predicted ATPase